MASDPPEESTETAVNGIRVPPETLTDFIPIITSLEHHVYLKFVFPSQFLELRFEPPKIEVRTVRALGIGSIADQGVVPIFFKRSSEILSARCTRAPGSSRRCAILFAVAYTRKLGLLPTFSLYFCHR